MATPTKTLPPPTGDQIEDTMFASCRHDNSDVIERLVKQLKTSEDKTALVNSRHKYTGCTPLHTACCHGSQKCIRTLLKYKADPLTYDKAGFSPIHTAAYYGQQEAVELLLLNCASCDVHMTSQAGETALHMACLGGHLLLARFLYEREGADLKATDIEGSRVLHFACASDCAQLVQWLLTQSLVLSDINTPNKRGHTPCHQACLLGCPNSLSALIKYDVNLIPPPFTLTTPPPHLTTPTPPLTLTTPTRTVTPPPLTPPIVPTPAELALELDNKCCHGIAEGTMDPLSLPPPPLPSSASGSFYYRENSQGTDPLRQSVASGLAFPVTRSSSSGSRASLFSSTSALQRRSSLLGTSRPVVLSIQRSSSLRRAEEGGGGGGGEGGGGGRLYLPSRDSATRLSQTLEEKKKSGSLDQLLYDRTAYEPPPDIIFVLPIEREVLTRQNRMFYSKSHNIKIRISSTFWDQENGNLDNGFHDSGSHDGSLHDNSPPNKRPPFNGTDKSPQPLPLCLCAAMHYSQAYPQGYTLVSPIVFLSCHTTQPCPLTIALPYAISLPQGERSDNRLVVLTTATARAEGDPESPLFSPSERQLLPLEGTPLQFEDNYVKFRTQLCHPSLFAVAVREGHGLPLPLRCSLFVLYPLLPPETIIAGFDVETYVGMRLKTVSKVVTQWAESHGFRFEEQHFLMPGEEITITGEMTSRPDDWWMERRGHGKLKYSQIALTQHTDRDTYSHQLVYPPKERFFIEPDQARGAVKCKIKVSSSISTLCSVLVVPYSPRRELTPEPSPRQRPSLPLPLSLTPSPPPPPRTHSLSPFERSPILRLPHHTGTSSESFV